MRGYAKQCKGDYDGALADQERAVQLNPNDDSSVYRNRGFVRDLKGDYDGAIADQSRAIAIDAKDARAYTYRGRAKQHKGDFDGALDDYRNAVDLNPTLQSTLTPLIERAKAKTKDTGKL